MKKSPILLLAYNRPNEFEKTLLSIASSNNASSHDLYINIDGANIYKDNDAQRQEKILRTAESYRASFKSLTIWRSERHMGLAKSVIQSVEKVLNNFDRIIVIEDDFLISRDCLDFIDGALNFYQNHPQIWSVTGYSAPLKGLMKYRKDVYFGYRGSSWVWGTWKDRWDTVDWDVRDYNSFLNDYRAQLRFCRGGYDLPNMLSKQMTGIIDSWAVRWCYAESKRDMLTVYPKMNRAVQMESTEGTHVIEAYKQSPLVDDCEPVSYVWEVDTELSREFRKHIGFSYSRWRKEFGVIVEIIKYEAMFFAMNLWKTISENGHTINEYFSFRGYRKVAIYGKGRIGLHIENEIAKSDDVQVAFFIDKETKFHDQDTCYYPEEDIPTCDVIVITVTTGIDDIKNLLGRKNKVDIKTLIEVLRDI